MSVSQRPYYSWYTAMHTRVDILLCANDSEDTKELQHISNEIRNEIKRIECLANRFDPQSELSTVNRNAFLSETAVSTELCTIIKDCLYYHQLTEGYFDITVNSLNNLRNGISLIELDVNRHTIRYLHPDLQIDLSGYIKGYALRKIKELLIRYEIDNALINLGNSSILAMGNHPCGEGWKLESTTLFNECLTTSGNTSGHLHIIDPVSGNYVQPAKPVSVVTVDPVLGEVFSTALYVKKNLARLNTEV